MLAGCNLFNGKDGVAYLKLTYDSWDSTFDDVTDGVLWSWQGFSTTSPTANQEYAVAAGSYIGKYIIYDNFSGYAGNGYYYNYITAFNDTSGYYYYNNYSGFAYNVNSYQADHSFTLANNYSYTITVNPGTALWKDGADKHFVINCAWIPTNTTISSSEVPASAAKIIEDSPDRVIKEITDGSFTLRLEIKKNAVPAPTNVHKSISQ